MKLRVECYSGNKADERPVRFYLGEQLRMVEEILDQWYGPNDIFSRRWQSVHPKHGNVKRWTRVES